jgi:hypothetical protein
MVAAIMAVYSEIGKPLEAVYLHPEKEGEFFHDEFYGQQQESEALLTQESKITLMGILAEAILTQKVDEKSIELKLNKIYKEYEREFPDHEDFINTMRRYLKLVALLLESQSKNIEQYAVVLLDKGEINVEEDFPDHFTTPEDYNLYCY